MEKSLSEMIAEFKARGGQVVVCPTKNLGSRQVRKRGGKFIGNNDSVALPTQY